ncbi:PREDICTED: uncharacterized protein LOC105962308 [Erythranthe guttata]|uniref:uncharacterized protein LOC105962308 n=1 Tax=Erythranthe guttata TaxID=4155 RepID=UPI00064D9563|nr:PREDICTED: uncharacterized protein LOC105962308 [Erythranthe guttata]|eukprot:XP_012842063.1 PREDICTED: uncharacterized protein LOC105962308 [Erythranthe guttata]
MNFWHDKILLLEVEEITLRLLGTKPMGSSTIHHVQLVVLKILMLDETIQRWIVWREHLKTIQVVVPDFDGKLNPEEYCDWKASLEALFEWKNLTEQRKVQLVATKLKGHALIWWQQYQRSRERKGLPRVATWLEMKLMMDEKFLPLDYNQTLYQKFHLLRQRVDQSVASYTEEFYKLMSRIELYDSNDQLVARYVAGLKSSIRGELFLLCFNSLAEAYQMALKAEEKLKWSSFRKSESSKSFNPKGSAKSHNSTPSPTKTSNQSTGQWSKDRGKSSQPCGKPCFRCGEPDHKAYECPKKNAEIHLVTEDQHGEEDSIPHFDDDFERESNEEYCQPDCDAESLVIQRLMSVQKDDLWLRHNIFRTHCLSGGKKCILMIDAGSCENMVSRTMIDKLNLKCENHPKPYKVS